MSKANLKLVAAILLSVAVGLLIATPRAEAQQTIDFVVSTLNGENLSKPTSLEFGPDGRLYVAQQNGTIYAYSIERTDTDENDEGEYNVIGTETINLVKDFVPNHDDDGSFNDERKRQVTGIVLTGTGLNPTLYVGSSDSRIGAGSGGGKGDVGLDTNSSVISRLSCIGGIDTDSEGPTFGKCLEWEKVDLVRGLPRSEENHSINGLQYDFDENILYAGIGGSTNAGAPSNNFAFLTEYAYDAAIISVDLDAIEALPVNTDTSLYSSDNYDYKWVYDLPTLDDPTRPNVSGEDGYTDENDPFGGNDGLNQAKLTPDSPVQIHSPGWRNVYDLVITESGRMYAIDNGANESWGGHPNGEQDYPREYSGIPTTGNCTNEYLLVDGAEPGAFKPGPGGDPGVNNLNGLHYVRELQPGDFNYVQPNEPYYAGHPTPIRGNPAGAGLFIDDTWYGPGSDELPDDWPPVPLDMAYAAECDFRNSGEMDGALAHFEPSTNGMAEYTATNLDGKFTGDLLLAAYDGSIYRVQLNEDGTASTNCPDASTIYQDNLDFIEGGGLAKDVETLESCQQTFAANFGIAPGDGIIPLDVTTQGDDDTFPGTVWAATYISGNVSVFEPTDYNGGTGQICLGTPDDDTIDEDNDGYTNADEVLNGKDPCSGTSKPEDYDNAFEFGPGFEFKRSDLQDPDDDNDGLNDIIDRFPLDCSNGFASTANCTDPSLSISTDFPVLYNFLNNDPAFGVGGIGFTGLMVNETNDYNELFVDPENKLIFGGTSGLFTIPFVESTTAVGAGNDQTNAFQFGINVTSASDPFTVNAQLVPPMFSGSAAANMSHGIQIGTGDMSNFLQIAVVANNGTGGIEVYYEENDIPVAAANQIIGVPEVLTASGINLYLSVNPQNGLVQPSYRINSGEIIPVGTPVQLTGNVLSAVQGNYQVGGQPSSVAIGTISSNGTSGTQFSATWDFIYVQEDLAETTAIAEIDSGSDIDSSTFSKGFNLTNTAPTQNITSVTFDISTAVIPEVVFDPNGTAGDVDAKGFDPGNGTDALTGVTNHVFGSPYDGGFYQLTVDFNDFNPGETLEFTVDIDPVSIKGFAGPGPNNSGSVSGLELAGSTVTVTFDNGDVQEVELYRKQTGNVNGASINTVRNQLPGIPSLEMLAVPVNPTALENEDQTIRITAPVQTPVRLLHLEAGLFVEDNNPATMPNNIDPFEVNSVININEYTGSTSNDGTIDFDIDLLRSNNEAGYNIFAAVTVAEDGTTSDLSNIIIVEYTPPGGSGPITNPPSDPAGFASILRVNAGGPEYTDGGGNVWLSDVDGADPDYSINGSCENSCVPIADPINGTEDDPLYQTERFNKNLQYAADVANGTYTVDLHFAEIFFNGAGSRVFDVIIEGNVVLDNYDIAAEVGGDVAVVKRFENITVTDNQLNIVLNSETGNGGTNNAKLSAFQVFAPQGSINPTAPPAGFESFLRINAGGPAYTDTEGNVWVSDQDGVNPDYSVNGLCTNSCEPVNTPIINTEDDPLYQTERYSKQLQYQVTTGNGTFAIDLHFAEIFFGVESTGAAGLRVFDVIIEGETVLDNYDIFADVGPATAAIKRFENITVNDNVLNVIINSNASVGGANNGKLSALEIYVPEGTMTEIPIVLEPAANIYNLEGDTPTTVIRATGGDGARVYSATGLPDGVTINTANGQFEGTLNPGTATTDGGVYNVEVTVDDSDMNPDDTETTTFTWVVRQAATPAQVIYRVNTGGPGIEAADSSTPAWSIDNEANPSPFLTSFIVSGSGTGFDSTTDPINVTDPSVSGGPAPEALFQTERFGTMEWDFPIPAGNVEVEVRLYLAETFLTQDNVQTFGTRAFNVSVEGATPIEFAAINPLANKGHDVAHVRFYRTTVTDGVLDLNLDSISQQPAIKGIEIVGIDGVPTIDTPVNGETLFTTVPNIQLTAGTPSIPNPQFLIEIATDVDFTNIVATRNFDLDPTFAPTLPLGTYYVRARQGDPTGAVSAWSDVTQFTVESNTPINLADIPNLFNQEGDTAPQVVAASGGDGNLSYAATGLPAGITLEPTNGQLIGAIDAGAKGGGTNNDGVYDVQVTVDDADTDPADVQTVTFKWVVGDLTENAEVLYRVNVGGSALDAADTSTPQWSEDTQANQSSLLTDFTPSEVPGILTTANAIDTTDSTINGGAAPEALFQTAREGNMDWAFPVDTGTRVEVRLYFAEIELTTPTPAREFSVTVEGAIPAAFEEINQFGNRGANTASARFISTVVSDGTLNLNVASVGGDAILSGIEIVSTESTPLVTAPTQGQVFIDGNITVTIQPGAPNDGNELFQIQVANDNLFNNVIFNSGFTNQTTANVTNLINGTYYVRARQGTPPNDLSAWSPVVTFTVNDSTNLIQNPDFSGDPNAYLYLGDISNTVVNEQLQMTRTNGAGFALVAQPINGTNFEAGNGVEATVDLGNTGFSAKYVILRMVDVDESLNLVDEITCTFNVPANPNLSTYTTRGVLPANWNNPSVQLFVFDFNTPSLLVDNFSVTKEATTPVTGTECVAPTTQENSNILANSQFAGLEAFYGFASGEPNGLTHFVNGDGVMELTRTGVNDYALMGQNTPYSVPANAPLQLDIAIGNSSNAPKLAAVRLWEVPNQTNEIFCFFEVPANTPLQAYQMAGLTNANWSNIDFQLFILDDGVPSLLVDDITVQYTPGVSLTETSCIEPAGNDTGMQPGVNLVLNGDFSNGDSFFSGFGAVTSTVIDETLYISRTSIEDFGLIYQELNEPVAANTPFEVKIDLGNTAGSDKPVYVRLFEFPNDSNEIICFFDVRANTPLQTYTMQGSTNTDWSRLDFQLITLDDNAPSLLVDNINIQYKPDAGIGTETTCLKPGEVAGADAGVEAIVESAAITVTQEAVPEVATAEPTTQPLVAALPASDNMDDGEDNWTPLGNWTLTEDAANGEAGMGWQISGTETASLTWNQPLDLTEATAPVLTLDYRLAAVNANAIVQGSINDIDWFTLGVLTPNGEWQTTEIDLSSFLGQTVTVRFAWIGGTDAAETWMLDNVAAAEVAATATEVPPTPTPVEVTEKTPTAEVETEAPAVETQEAPAATAEAEVPVESVDVEVEAPVVIEEAPTTETETEPETNDAQTVDAPVAPVATEQATE